MSMVENNQSLNNILNKLGIQPQEQKKRADGGSLGQEDFLKLMTTQLQNQDPFAPMENADFIAQMAQFSTVTGITDIGQSLKGISNQLSEFRIATGDKFIRKIPCWCLVLKPILTQRVQCMALSIYQLLLV